MSSQTKPLYEIQRKIQYKRHLLRLEHIGKERSRRVLEKDTIAEMHRRRNYSQHFQTQQHMESINQENEKIITRLLSIAKRRSHSIIAEEPPKIIKYQNPARKRLKREIERNNIALAERILAKQSQFDQPNQKKMISEYQKTKKMLERNKHVSLSQFEQITLKASREQPHQQNPNF